MVVLMTLRLQFFEKNVEKEWVHTPLIASPCVLNQTTVQEAYNFAKRGHITDIFEAWTHVSHHYKVAPSLMEFVWMHGFKASDTAQSTAVTRGS